MITKQQSHQDAFLNDLRKKGATVSIYLASGIKLQGTIERFDQFAVFLKSHVEQMVYKHAIATIIPAESKPKAPLSSSSAPSSTDSS